MLNDEDQLIFRMTLQLRPPLGRREGILAGAWLSGIFALLGPAGNANLARSIARLHMKQNS